MNNFQLIKEELEWNKMSKMDRQSWVKLLL